MGRGVHESTKRIAAAAYEILEQIQPASVRAVCYKLFVRGLIPNMSKGSTDKVGKVLVKAREDGIIPWYWIVDGSREAQLHNTWDSPKQKMEAAMRNYRFDFWNEQKYRVHLIAEKETVASTLRPVLDEFAVPVSFMKGFASATAVNGMVEMINDSNKPMRFLYVGDWDPSGMYMSEEDLPERLKKYGGGDAWLERIAIKECDTLSGIPHFSAYDKTGDTRYPWFIERYGDRCWELDAMDPNELRARLRKEIEDWIDPHAWDHSQQIEDAQRESMKLFMSRMPG